MEPPGSQAASSSGGRRLDVARSRRQRYGMVDADNGTGKLREVEPPSGPATVVINPKDM
jgi:hypothetical protein